MPRSAIDRMSQEAKFQISKIEFDIPTKQATIEITMALIIQGDEHPRVYPLSGFPRRLAMEEPTGSK
jgi:hypothetical protein